MLNQRQRGSVPIESTFAIILILTLVLGAIEVAFALYGRNVVLASAHEAARAGVEVGRTPEEAAAIAEDSVRRSANGLMDSLDVDVAFAETAAREVVHVRVRGELRPFGPVPLPISIDTVATASREVQVE